MADAETLFFFDFSDPLSYLLERELAGLPEAASMAYRAFELLPPPQPLVSTADPPVAQRWQEAGTVDALPDLQISPPRLAPWTRKAHELHLLAAEEGGAELAARVRRAIFDAYVMEGRDIGRVDVLLDVAVSHGLERGHAKATLDVDRLEASVRLARARAESAGVSEPATLVRGSRTLRGFHNAGALRTFLRP